MKRKPRTRAAHLGHITYEGSLYRATFRGGWVHFHKRHSRKPFESLTLHDIYKMAQVQKSFAFIPKS